MIETLLTGKGIIPVGPSNSIDFSAMTPRSWSGSAPTASATLAPNGDACQAYADTGAASTLIDLTSLLGSDGFTIGAYFYPTSYQAQYGTAAPSATVFHLGPFSGVNIGGSMRPGTGTGSLLTNSFGTTIIDTESSPVGAWRHMAFSYDPVTKLLRGFSNGRYVGQQTNNPPTTKILSVGGIGDRSGVVGGNQARYGYRGLVSVIRFSIGAITDSFDPLAWK